MARKSSTQMFEEAQKGMTSGKAKRFNEARFVNFELDVKLQKQCKDWAFTAQDAWDTIAKWEDSGYKFTFKYDGYSKSSAVFVSTTQETDPNFGYILTGRGSSPFKAIKQAVFKHFVCFDSAPWEGFAERPNGVELDD